MRKALILLPFILLFSCSNDNDSNPNQQETSTTKKLLFLQVSFLDYQFERAKLYEFEGIESTLDIPLEEIRLASGDGFTNDYKLIFTPNNSVVFNGNYGWMAGCNEPYIPESSEFTNASEYSVSEINTSINWQNVQYYDSSFIINNQNNQAEDYPIDYEQVWNAISSLDITHQFINNQGKIAILLYTPTIGLIDTECTKWFVILYE